MNVRTRNFVGSQSLCIYKFTHENFINKIIIVDDEIKTVGCLIYDYFY